MIYYTPVTLHSLIQPVHRMVGGLVLKSNELKGTVTLTRLGVGCTERRDCSSHGMLFKYRKSQLESFASLGVRQTESCHPKQRECCSDMKFNTSSTLCVRRINQQRQHMLYMRSRLRGSTACFPTQVTRPRLILLKIGPKPRATKVAMVYPSVPISRLGTMLDFQPLDAAMPAAVVGPPTLAFEANSIDRRLHPVILPKPRSRPRCIKTCNKANRKSAGAFRATCAMDPFAPTAAKNTCTPSAWYSAWVVDMKAITARLHFCSAMTFSLEGTVPASGPLPELLQTHLAL